MSNNSESPVRHYDPLITRNALAAELAVHKTTIWRWCKEGEFPQPVRIGGRVGWPQSVVRQWQISKGWPLTEGEA